MKMQKYCAKCGKQFKGAANETYCPTCKLELALYRKNNAAIIAKQNEVMNYIRDNQFSKKGVTSAEVMRDMGVSKEFLTSMIRDDFFGSAVRQNKKYPHPCAKCGVTIETGVYCRDCLYSLRKEAKNIGEQNEFRKRVAIEEELQNFNNNLILVVDANNRGSDRTKKMLREFITDHRIVTANDSMHAINILHSLKVKLLLIDDAITEEYDGLRLLREIREDAAISNTPVIMTTAHPEEVKKNIAMRLDARDYLKKPLDSESLEECVRAVLSPKIEYNIENRYEFLLIDDNEDEAEIEKNILEKNLHCTVFTAGSGIEGLSVLQVANNTDLIFISLKMSFMDGLRVLDFIRQNEFFRGFPVIFLSDSDDPEVKSMVEKSPAVGYINKPEISAESIKFIKNILKKGR